MLEGLAVESDTPRRYILDIFTESDRSTGCRHKPTANKVDLCSFGKVIIIYVTFSLYYL